MSAVQRTRDRERSRGKIVAAARAEFAARGYAGARMAHIAKRAAINKELIYHYFRGKEHLFEEVRSEQRADAAAGNPLPPNPLLDRTQRPSELFAWRFQRMLGDLEWIKLLTWEAARGDLAPNEDARRATIKQAVAIIEDAQNNALLPAELDPRLLQLAVFALATYPLAFSQITSMTTGMSASDKRFHASWTAFLRRLGACLLVPSAARVSVTEATPARRQKKSVSKGRLLRFREK
jgi:TetR/AcrR family transcriptional regulator